MRNLRLIFYFCNEIPDTMTFLFVKYNGKSDWLFHIMWRYHMSCQLYFIFFKWICNLFDHRIEYLAAYSTWYFILGYNQ